ncbi:MAG: hypothetical protein ACRDLL_07275 [Solirubrobacterales bacterium]
MATGFVAFCIALAAAALFTPPGQAVTSWVRDRLGVGRPGEHPTLRQLRAFSSAETAAEGQPAYVLVRGLAPHGDRYEFITYRSKYNHAHCFEVDLPKNRSLYGGGCGGTRTPGNLPSKNGVAIVAAGGNSDIDQRLHFVSGRVSSDVDFVRVAISGHPTKVELKAPPRALLEELGFDHSFKVFIAFLYGAVEHGGTIEVSAVRHGAGVVGNAELNWPNFTAINCRSVERMAEQKELSEKNARRFCLSVGTKPAR